MYENLIKAQQLSELEELVEFHTLRHIVLQAETPTVGQNRARLVGRCRTRGRPATASAIVTCSLRGAQRAARLAADG